VKATIHLGSSTAQLLRRRQGWLLVAGLIAVLCVTGSAAGRPTGAAALPVLRVGITGISDPNPAKYPGGASAASAWSLAYEPLIIQKADGSYVPGVASSWRYFSTGRGRNKDFELTLRGNARFSDGTPVTAATVANWFRYWLKNTFPNEAASLGPKPTVTTSGRLKVQLHLTIPNPGLPNLVSQYPIALGWIASPKATANPSLFAEGRSYGAGPYMLNPSRTVLGDHYTFVPNPFYYDKSKIRYREVDVKVIANPSSMLQALRAGQLDVVEGDVTTQTAAKSARYNVISAPAGEIGFWQYGLGKGVLKDVRVRQAIAYAIDRNAISRTLLTGTATSQMLTTDGNDQKYINFYPYNPAKAKSLLAAAGYAGGLNLTMVSMGFAGVVGDPVAQAVAKNLDAVGIHVKITPAGSLTELVNDLGGQFDLVQVPFSVYSTAQTFQFFFVPKTGYLSAVAGLSDLTLAKLYYTAIKSSTPGKYWRAMMARVTEQAYPLLVGTRPGLWYTKNVKGIEISIGTPAAYLGDWSPA
jgi:peptide/nickel transport system substrate-binding protein